MIKELFEGIAHIFHSNHPLLEFFNDLWQIVLSIWDYQIFVTADKQAVLISNIILGLILFAIGAKVVKKLNLLLKKKLLVSLSEEGMINSLERLSYYFFMMLMVIFVLDVSNVPLTVFTVIGTTLALGIGLGSQNVVNNFISGIIIMIERPIKIGDIIEVKNIVGEVTNIGARCTSLRTNKNINMLIPNSNILQDIIVNWTLEDTILKTSLDLIIENKISITAIDAIILKVLDDHPQVLKNPAPQIILKSLCSNGYEIEIEFWIDLALNGRSMYIINDINRTLAPILKTKNIAIIDKYPFSHLQDPSATHNIHH